MTGEVLRAALLGIGGGCLAIAALLWLAGGALPVPFAILGLVLAGGVLFERWRYKPLGGERPGPDWVATGERFVDPETGKLVTVFYQPATGERRYVVR